MIDTVNIPTNILPDIKHTPFSTPVLKMNPFPPLKKKGKSLLFVGMPRWEEGRRQHNLAKYRKYDSGNLFKSFWFLWILLPGRILWIITFLTYCFWNSNGLKPTDWWGLRIIMSETGCRFDEESSKQSSIFYIFSEHFPFKINLPLYFPQ